MTTTNRSENQKSAGWRQRLVPVIHWILGLIWTVLVLWIWQYLVSAEQERLEARFHRETEQLLDGVRERIYNYSELLNASASMIRSHSQGLNVDEWRTYVEALRITERYPGALGMMVVFEVKEKNLASFIEHQKREFPQFQLYPQLEADTHYPIALGEPFDENSQALGLDLAFEPHRLAAIQKAFATNQIVITKPLVLVQDEAQSPGLILMAPFVQRNLPGSSFAEKVRGLVCFPMVFADFMKAAKPAGESYIYSRVLAEGAVLYEENEEDRLTRLPLFEKTERVDVFGADWIFVIRSSRALERSASYQSTTVLGAGAIIGILLFFLTKAIVMARDQAIKIARELGEEAQTQRANAINSAKMASLGQMAAGIAHEINNPLATITANISVIEVALQRETPNVSLAQKSVQSIRLTVDRVAEIVAGLRMIVGKESQQVRERINLRPTFEMTCSFSTERLKQKKIELYNEIDPNHWIWAHRTQISQVFLNFLNNSTYAIKNSDERWIRVVSEQDQKTIKIRFIDSGRGIQGKDIDNLFDPFFTTKPVGEGSGLGLSISSGIVASYGGKIYYDKKAMNTCFVIELPRADLDGPVAPGAP